jgi:hypothetical protein
MGDLPVYACLNVVCDSNGNGYLYLVGTMKAGECRDWQPASQRVAAHIG